MNHVWKKRGVRHVTLTDGITAHDSGHYFSSAPIMSHETFVLILGWIKSFSHLNGKQEVLGSRMKIYQTWSEKENIVTEAYGAQWCSARLRLRSILVFPFREQPPRCLRSTDAALRKKW